MTGHSKMKNTINWKLFWILLGACVFGVVAVVPYMLTVQADLLRELPIPLQILLPIQILQNAVLFAVFILIGLYLAKRVGFGAPILESLIVGKGEEVKTYLKSVLNISIVLGVLIGAVAIAGDFLFSILSEPITPTQAITPPIWQRFLVSFYGAINEEIAFRLFLMTLLVWIFHRIRWAKEDKPTNLSIWLAIVIAAFLFGVGHLPFMVTLTSIELIVIARIIILNAIGGIFFGWLYWRKGLESAMLSHFTADVVLHVIFPLAI